MKYNDNTYFAAAEEDIADRLFDRVEQFYKDLDNIGRMELWHKCHKAYFISYYNGGQLRFKGDHSEYVVINVNELRNILTHTHRLTTHQRPKFEPIATNTDWASQGQTLLARGILDYYMREKRIERYLTTADEHSGVYGEGFVELEWDATGGEIADFDMDELPVMQGDIEFYNLTPNNVIRDCSKEAFSDQNWLITRKFVNKYDLAAKYEDLAEDILDLDWNESPTEYKTSTRFGFELANDNETSDDVAYYTFYHKPTDALPNGRLVVFLNNEIVLIDTGLPYKSIPVFRTAPAEQDGIPFGYSVAFDLLPLQEHLDFLYSAVVTNQEAFGVQNIIAPRASRFDATTVANGLQLLEYDPVDGMKPEALNLTNTPPEIVEFLDKISSQMETISGVNSVVRGDPQASLKSGAALALVQAQSIQFNSGQQQAYYALLEDVGTGIIDILKDYASMPRMVAIAGKSQRSMIRSFTSDDLADISRVTVQAGNPLSATPAGRLQIAEQAIQNGFISTPEEWLMLLQTGDMETVTEADTAELMLIRSENEDMVEGKTVPAIAIDQHDLHIKEHKVVISTPEARQNPELVKVVLAHIMEHIKLSASTDSFLLTLLGQQVHPLNALMAEQQMGGGAAPMPEGTDTGAGAVMNPQAPGDIAAHEVQPAQQPSMPTNPLTGNEWNPNDGGM